MGERAIEEGGGSGAREGKVGEETPTFNLKGSPNQSLGHEGKYREGGYSTVKSTVE